MADARQTKNAYLQQLAGLLSFCFTNGYLAYRHFRKSWVQVGKCADGNQGGLSLPSETQRLPSSLSSAAEEVTDKAHVLVLLEKPTKAKDGKVRKFQRYREYCFYCQHNPDKVPSKQKTSWHCETCVGSNGEVHTLYAHSTGRKCFQMHIVHGLPPKQRSHCSGLITSRSLFVDRS